MVSDSVTTDKISIVLETIPIVANYTKVYHNIRVRQIIPASLGKNMTTELKPTWESRVHSGDTFIFQSLAIGLCLYSFLSSCNRVLTDSVGI